MTKRGVIGCQVELKPAERGQEAVDKLKSVENRPDLSCRNANSGKTIIQRICKKDGKRFKAQP
jgi:hypothetical protein